MDIWNGRTFELSQQVNKPPKSVDVLRSYEFKSIPQSHAVLTKHRHVHRLEGTSKKKIEWAPVILRVIHITSLLLFRSLGGLWKLRSVTGEGELIVMGCPLTAAIARHFWQALKQAAT